MSGPEVSGCGQSSCVLSPSSLAVHVLFVLFFYMQSVRRLREFEATEPNRERQFVVAVSANIDDNIVGTSGFDLQRSKPLRERDILQCMSLCTPRTSLVE